MSSLWNITDIFNKFIHYYSVTDGSILFLALKKCVVFFLLITEYSKLWGCLNEATPVQKWNTRTGNAIFAFYSISFFIPKNLFYFQFIYNYSSVNGTQVISNTVGEIIPIHFRKFWFIMEFFANSNKEKFWACVCYFMSHLHLFTCRSNLLFRIFKKSNFLAIT